MGPLHGRQSKSQKVMSKPSSDTSDDDIDINDCLSFDYQLRDGFPGFEIELNHAGMIAFGLYCLK